MTTLTCSSFDGKSVKVSLISVEFRHGQTQPPPPYQPQTPPPYQPQPLPPYQPQPPPPYQPELLETGDGGLPNDSDDESNMCMQLVDDFIDENALARVCAYMIVLLLCATFCNLHIDNSFQSIPLLPLVLQDTEDNSEIVFTCYPSYAFAESDTLLLPGSPPPSSKNIDPVEGVIRKAPLITITRFLFVIDSSVNITGIVDLDSQRCYVVMQLLHNYFEPHGSLCNTLLELSPGHYSLDNINNILSYFHVVNPAITNLSDYGMYISKHCTDYPTFKMERYNATDSLYEVYQI